MPGVPGQDPLLPAGHEKPGKKRVLRKIRKEVWAVALIEQDGRYLIHRKEGQGLLAGLWQFPIVVLEEKISGEARQERKIIRGALKDRFGLRINVKTQLPAKEHQFTHMDVTMKPFRCSLAETFPADKVPRDTPLGETLQFLPLSHLHGHVQNRRFDSQPETQNSKPVVFTPQRQL